MPFTEIAPGHFQRAIGENETFIKIIGDPGHPLGHEHWAINADASFHHREPIASDELLARWEDAWKTLRFKHPSIAATASDTHIEYTVPDAAALQLWSSETFVIVKGKSQADVAASIKPSRNAVLYVLPDSGEVILHTAHWRSDGIGILQLLDAFFDLAAIESLPDPAGLSWGQETSRLAPSIEEAADIPREPNDKIRAEAEKWTKTFYGAAGAVGIECSAAKETVPGGTRTARTAFSESDTAAIVRACKAQNISVTSAVHAALAKTNYAFATSDSQSKHYTSTIRVALRPYLPEPYCTPAYASGLYTSGWMHSMPAGTSFIDCAKGVNNFYRQGLDSDFLEAHRQYALNLQDLIRSTPPDGPQPSDVDISSVGIVDDIVKPTHGNLEITRVSVGVEVLTRQMVCFVWTFRGQLSMNLVYNGAFYDAGVPVKFVEKLKDILVKELDVKV